MGPSAERAGRNFSYKYSLASCRIKNIDETPFLFLRFYSRKTQKRLKDFTC